MELVAVASILHGVLPREVSIEGLSFAEAVCTLDLIGGLPEEALAKWLYPAKTDTVLTATPRALDTLVHMLGTRSGTDDVGEVCPRA